MNILEFSSLTQHEQLDFLADVGLRLSKRLDEEYDIILYKLDEFFVEVFYHRKRLKIMHLLAFCHDQIPDAYFESEELTAQKFFTLSQKLLEVSKRPFPAVAALKINLT